jgi:hypothetical protein
MVGLYLANLKRMASGTSLVVGAATKRCLDVFVRNDAAHPIFVAGVSGMSVLEYRFHDTNVTNINNSAGAYVEIDTPAALANVIQKIIVSPTFGEPLIIRAAADAAAAAAQDLAGAAPVVVLNRGQTVTVEASLAVGDRLWVKSLSATLINSGELVLNLIG